MGLMGHHILVIKLETKFMFCYPYTRLNLPNIMHLTGKFPNVCTLRIPIPLTRQLDMLKQ